MLSAHCNIYFTFVSNHRKWKKGKSKRSRKQEPHNRYTYKNWGKNWFIFVKKNLPFGNVALTKCKILFLFIDITQTN